MKKNESHKRNVYVKYWVIYTFCNAIIKPYMATMVYRGIFLIYHSLPWYIRYIPQLEALMSPTQSDIYTVSYSANIQILIHLNLATYISVILIPVVK